MAEEIDSNIFWNRFIVFSKEKEEKEENLAGNFSGFFIFWWNLIGLNQLFGLSLIFVKRRKRKKKEKKKKSMKYYFAVIIVVLVVIVLLLFFVLFKIYRLHVKSIEEQLDIFQDDGTIMLFKLDLTIKQCHEKWQLPLIILKVNQLVYGNDSYDLQIFCFGS